ncbi:hypothetical protein D3C80_959310 [compost metagenome]
MFVLLGKRLLPSGDGCLQRWNAEQLRIFRFAGVQPHHLLLVQHLGQGLLLLDLLLQLSRQLMNFPVLRKQGLAEFCKNSALADRGFDMRQGMSDFFVRVDDQIKFTLQVRDRTYMSRLIQHVDLPSQLRVREYSKADFQLELLADLQRFHVHGKRQAGIVSQSEVERIIRARDLPREHCR